MSAAPKLRLKSMRPARRSDAGQRTKLLRNPPRQSGFLPGPAELGAVNPDAVHDYGQPACQCDDRLLHSAAPGDLHRPGLEP
jgi:hypothetical protein